MGCAATRSLLPNPAINFVDGRVSIIVAGILALWLALLGTAHAQKSTRSSPIAVSADGLSLVVANPDSSSISVVDTMTMSVLAQIKVGANPRTVALSLDDKLAYVTNQGANELSIIDVRALTLVERIPLGHEPYGVAIVPGTGRLMVTNQGEDTVWIIRPDNFVVEHTFDVADSPRAIAISGDGSRAYVSHFLTRGKEGVLTEINLKTSSVSREVRLLEDTSPDTEGSGRGFPNLLSALAINPGGDTLWYGGLKSNTNRGLFLSGQRLIPTNRVRGVAGLVVLSAGEEQFLGRIDTNDADIVSAIAFAPGGRFAFFTHSGAGRVSVYDLELAQSHNGQDGSVMPFTARIDVGDVPNGIVFSPSGMRAYVSNFLSRDVTVLETSNPTTPRVLQTVSVTDEPLSHAVALGKKLFNGSREPVHSIENYIACGSCHPEGGTDGRTWDFTSAGEGLRNTIDLRGHGGMNDGPLHWSAK